MVQLRPSGKAYQVAQKILKQQGVKVPPPKSLKKLKVRGPYLQH